MSNDCDSCGEHCLDCVCDINDDGKIKFAINSIGLGLNTLSMLGYELVSKIEFKKISPNFSEDLLDKK